MDDAIGTNIACNAVSDKETETLPPWRNGRRFGLKSGCPENSKSQECQPLTIDSGKPVGAPNSALAVDEGINPVVAPDSPPPPIGGGSIVLVRMNDGWIVGKCLAATPQVCLVEIQHVRTREFSYRERTPNGEIELASLSDCDSWPPNIPDDFPLTPTGKGYVARINGKPTWICGKHSPRVAYAKYLRMVQRGLRPDQYKIGQHAAFSWTDIFVPAHAPDWVIEEGVRRQVSSWAYLPTIEAPERIRKVQGLQYFDGKNQPESCVYFLCFKGHVVYVGKSRNLRSRCGDHATHKRFDAIYFAPCRDEDAERMEAKFIRKLRPVYNIKDNPDGKLKVILERIQSSVLSPPPHTAPAGEGGGA